METDERDAELHNLVDEEFREPFHSRLQALFTIWNDLGVPKEQITERTRVVMHHLISLLKDMFAEEEIMKENLLTNIKKWTEENIVISEELSVIPFKPDENLPFLNLENELRMHVDKLRMIRHERIKSLKQLKDQEKELCEKLRVPSHDLVMQKTVPSEEQLKELDQHVQMMKKEKIVRLKKFQELKVNLHHLMSLLEKDPNTTFEISALCDDEEEFVLSHENLNSLKEFLIELEKEKNLMDKKFQSHQEELFILWDRLDIDSSYRHTFLSTNSECRPKIIKAFKLEIERCQELKKENLQSFIEKAREELNLQYNKCCICEEERHIPEFLDVTDNITEELLEAYECEIKRLKMFYDECESIFKSIERRSHVWSKMLEFEKKASDPSRFNNRGGGLLQEEKERRQLTKELPKLEKQLSEDIDEWESLNNKKFLIWGETLQSYLERQWRNHTEQQGQEKIKRQQQRSKQFDGTFSAKRKLTHATPNKTPKMARLEKIPSTVPKAYGASSTPRGLLYSPLNKVACRSARKSRMPVKRLALNKKHLEQTPRTARQILVEKNTLDAPTSGSLFDIPPTSFLNLASYADFTNELNRNGKSQCRSTMVSPSLSSYRSASVQKANKQNLYADKSSYSAKKQAPSSAQRCKNGLPFLM